MTTTIDIDHNGLAKKLKHLMSTTTLNEVERILHINRRYLYDIKNNKFEAVPMRIWLAIQHYFDSDQAAQNGSKWQIAHTENLSIAVGVFKKAQNEKLCLGLVGTTGFGKTQSAKIYRQKKNGVVYVHCNTEMTKNQFLDAILFDLGIAPQHRGGNTQEKIWAIVRNLTKLEMPLLIIDDAGKLRDSAFRMFQILFDEAGGRIGFVLTGVPEFKTKVFRNADKGAFCYKEIARRIGWTQLGSITKADVKAICEKNDIKDPSAISYLIDNIGDFDNLKRLIEAAKAANLHEGKVITEGVVIDRNFFAHRVGDAIKNYRVSYVK